MPGAITATTHTATRTNDWLYGLFAFALMVAYWPGIAGVATTARWDVAVLLTIPLLFAPRIRMGAAHWTGLLLIGWLFLSLLWNDGGHDGWLDGVQAAIDLLIVAVAFVVGSTIRSIRGFVIGAALGIGVNSVIAVAQWCGWDGFGDTIQRAAGTIPGLFYERGRLGAAAAIVTVALIALPRLWLLLPLTLPALILSGSRAGWVAAGLGIVVAKVPHPRRLLAVVTAMAVLAAIAVLVFGVKPDLSNQDRIAIWRDTIANVTPFGHGLGSFREVFLRDAASYDYARFGLRPEAPHNEWLLLAFEGGYIALALGLVLACQIWRAAEDHQARGILIAFCVPASLAMALHDPASVVPFAIVAGHCVRRHDLVCRALVAGRPSLCEGLAAACTTSGIE